MLDKFDIGLTRKKGKGSRVTHVCMHPLKESFAQITTNEGREIHSKRKYRRRKGIGKDKLCSVSSLPHTTTQQTQHDRQEKETLRVMCPSGQGACGYPTSSSSPFVIVLCRCFTLWEREGGRGVGGREKYKKKGPDVDTSSSNVCLPVCAWILPRGKNRKRGFDLSVVHTPSPFFFLFVR